MLRVTAAVCWRLPLVAVIVTGKLFGVVVLVEEALVPPHPLNIRDVAAMPANSSDRERRRPILRRIRLKPITGNSSRAKATDVIPPLIDGTLSIALIAAVWMVTVTV